MSVELLSALAKRAGHETFLNVLQHRDLSDTVRKIKPDVVAYSGKTGEHNTFFKVNRFLKDAYGDKIFTIMGGPHPTFNNKGIQLFGEQQEEVPAFQINRLSASPIPEIPIERSDLDALCIKEGDDAWVEMLGQLQRGEGIDHIPNIVTRSNRKIYPEPQFRERRIDLDDLPYYDRQLIYDKTFLAHFPMRNFMSSRGCPFRCTYCFNFEWNRTYRTAGKIGKLHNRYSVDRLIAEIQDMRRIEQERGYAPTQFIKFYDDMFEFRVSPWLEEFAEKFPKEVGLPFFCLIRCDIFAHEEKDGSVKLNEDVLLLLKKAGLRSISMSIESGNNFVRENILVRDMTEKEIRAAFGLMVKHKIGTFSNTILGIPAPVIPHPGEYRFDEKLHKAIRETKMAYTVVKKTVEPGRGGAQGYPAELDAVMTNLEGTPTDDMRRRGVQLLEGMGLKHNALDYDIEAVQINLDCKVHYAEFPRLDPYPGTVMTEYTKAIGAFDGDFEKLHSSTETTSSFTCFTKRQKLVQDNLSFLGQICMVWPWLWPVSKKYLIYLPLTNLYWFFFMFAKTWAIKRHVYPMKFSLKSALRSAYRVTLVEYKKFFRGNPEENFYKKPHGIKAAASPTDILGGRWES